MFVYGCEESFQNNNCPQSQAQQNSEIRDSVLTLRIDDSLDCENCDHDESMIAEDQISQHNSTCATNVSEVPDGGVDTIEHIAGDVHDQVVKGITLHPTSTSILRFIFVILIDLPIK